jgi:tetratricopeptide (TPR) repeat protein
MRAHAIALVLALMPLRVQAQAAIRVSSYADVERAVEHAVELQAGGSYASAGSLLQEAAVQCANLGDDQGRCTHLLNFSLGYICQREAARPGSDEALLDLAVMYYERVLRASDGAADPVVGDAVYNLALLFRTLEPHESQEAFYRRAPELDPPRAALYFTFLGDYLVRTGRQDEARRAYRSAAQADPDDPAPRAGLLDTYRQVGTDDAPVLLRLGEDWEQRFPDIAARAYRMVIDAAHRARSPLAEEALLRHVRLMASREAGTPAAIAQLSRDWPPVAMLEAFYESPSNARTRASWWLDTRERAQLLARVALAIGQQHVAAGRLAAAESYWTAARMFADAGTPRRLI